MKEEKEKGYEYENLRICKHNIQRETCRNCLFDVLCNLEEQKWKATHEAEKTLGKNS